MQEVAQFTFTYEQFPEAMGMLWKRMLQDNRSNWRRTYKVSEKTAEIAISGRRGGVRSRGSHKVAGVAGDVGLESMWMPQFRGADVGHCSDYSAELADFGERRL